MQLKPVLFKGLPYLDRGGGLGRGTHWPTLDCTNCSTHTGEYFPSQGTQKDKAPKGHLFGQNVLEHYF